MMNIKELKSTPGLNAGKISFGHFPRQAAELILQGKSIKGKIKMIDISGKRMTKRVAVASVVLRAARGVVTNIKNGKLAKGDCLAAAQVAGILAAKNTSSIIPLCHQINLSKVSVDFRFHKDSIEIISTVKADYATGVEMEALLACSVAALTIYDMAKAETKNIVISDLKLLEKAGGKSGDYKAKKG